MPSICHYRFIWWGTVEVETYSRHLPCVKEIAKLGTKHQVQMAQCPVTQQHSLAQDVVSNHIHKVSPEKTMVDRRYVQWLAFESILLTQIFPQICPWIRIPNGTVFMNIPQHCHLSFPSRSGQGRYFYTLDRVESPPPLPPSLLMCLQAACIHFPLSMGDTPIACWFSLAPGERALTMGVLVRTIFLS